MQHRQYGSVAHRVEELVGVPAGGQRSRLRLSVADRHGYDQVGIVEGCPKPVRDAVTQFTAFVDGSRGLRRAVAADASGKRELLQKLVQARHIPAFLRIDL